MKIITVNVQDELHQVVKKKAGKTPLSQICSELLAIWVDRKDLAVCVCFPRERQTLIAQIEMGMEQIRQKQLIGWENLILGVQRLLELRDVINAKKYISQGKKAVSMNLSPRKKVENDLEALDELVEAAEREIRLESIHMFQSGPPKKPGTYVVVNSSHRFIATVASPGDPVTQDSSITHHFLLPAMPRWE